MSLNLIAATRFSLAETESVNTTSIHESKTKRVIPGSVSIVWAKRSKVCAIGIRNVFIKYGFSVSRRVLQNIHIVVLFSTANRDGDKHMLHVVVMHMERFQEVPLHS